MWSSYKLWGVAHLNFSKKKKSHLFRFLPLVFAMASRRRPVFIIGRTLAAAKNKCEDQIRHEIEKKKWDFCRANAKAETIGRNLEEYEDGEWLLLLRLRWLRCSFFRTLRSSLSLRRRCRRSTRGDEGAEESEESDTDEEEGVGVVGAMPPGGGG